MSNKYRKYYSGNIKKDNNDSNDKNKNNEILERTGKILSNKIEKENNKIIKKKSQEIIEDKNNNNNNITSNINSPNKNNISKNYSQKNNSNNNDKINKKDSQTSIKNSKRNSQVKIIDNNNKIKTLIINSQSMMSQKNIENKIIEKCKIKDEKIINFEFINYEEYQNKKDNKDFFNIYLICFCISKNEIYKNIDKIFEIEEDIENYNPFVYLRIFEVNSYKDLDIWVKMPEYPFSDNSENNKKYKKFKENKNKYQIITYYPEFYVCKEKNILMVKIFFPYVFDEFSNNNNRIKILDEQLFHDNIYMKSNYYNYLINIEGCKNNYLELTLNPNIISSYNFGYFKINFDLPLDTFGKEVLDYFEKKIDYSNFDDKGIINIIFKGKKY